MPAAELLARSPVTLGVTVMRLTQRWGGAGLVDGNQTKARTKAAQLPSAVPQRAPQRAASRVVVSAGLLEGSAQQQASAEVETAILHVL